MELTQWHVLSSGGGGSNPPGRLSGPCDGPDYCVYG